MDSGGDGELQLSPATLAALKSFAVTSGITSGAEGDDDNDNILESVARYFELKDKYDTFPFKFESNSRSISFNLKGVKRELGQTLASTGLTM